METSQISREIPERRAFFPPLLSFPPPLNGCLIKLFHLTSEFVTIGIRLGVSTERKGNGQRIITVLDCSIFFDSNLLIEENIFYTFSILLVEL